MTHENMSLSCTFLKWQVNIFESLAQNLWPAWLWNSHGSLFNLLFGSLCKLASYFLNDSNESSIFHPKTFYYIFLRLILKLSFELLIWQYGILKSLIKKWQSPIWFIYIFQKILSLPLLLLRSRNCALFQNHYSKTTGTKLSDYKIQ